MHPDITKLSETELKAIAYDQVKLLEQTRVNIQVIEAELAKRAATRQNSTEEELPMPHENESK